MLSIVVCLFHDLAEDKGAQMVWHLVSSKIIEEPCLLSVRGWVIQIIDHGWQ
jgi:hypothetical protein